MPVVLAILGPVLRGVAGFLTTTPGLMIVAALLGVWWEGGRCRSREAEARAAIEAKYKADLAAQAQITRELAKTATERLVEEQDASAERQAQIEATGKDDANDGVQQCQQVDAKGVVRTVRVFARPCVVDDSFARDLRQLRAVHSRGVARRPR